MSTVRWSKYIVLIERDNTNAPVAVLSIAMGSSISNPTLLISRPVGTSVTVQIWRVVRVDTRNTIHQQPCRQLRSNNLDSMRWSSQSSLARIVLLIKSFNIYWINTHGDTNSMKLKWVELGRSSVLWTELHSSVPLPLHLYIPPASDFTNTFVWSPFLPPKIYFVHSTLLHNIHNSNLPMSTSSLHYHSASSLATACPIVLKNSTSLDMFNMLKISDLLKCLD